MRLSDRIDVIDNLLAELDVLADGMRQCQRKFDIQNKITAARTELGKLRSRVE